jgi:hypothetical protein
VTSVIFKRLPLLALVRVAFELVQLHPDGGFERRQFNEYGLPDDGRMHYVVLVAIDVAGGGDGLPIDLLMALSHLLRKAPARLRNDLERPNHSVERLPICGESRQIHVGHEFARRRAIDQDVL